MKRIFATLCLFLIVCFGCSTSHKNKNMKVFRVNTSTEPPTIDPRKSCDNVSAYFCKLVYDGLTRISVEDKPILSLAKSYTLSEDQKEYIFKLKKAYWSDGSEITAFDYVETLKETLKPDFPAFASFLLYYIENAKKAKEGKVSLDEIGVVALDKETLKFKLDYPNPDFLRILAAPIFAPYPKRVAEANLKYLEDHSLAMISSGPFVPIKWKTNDRVIFKRNDHYWDREAVKLDEIHLSFVPDQQTELSLYEQKNLDWAGAPFSSLPIDAIDHIKDREDFHTYMLSGTYYYEFNTKKFPFNNKNIRKALTYAVNRKDLVDHVFQTSYEPATALIPNIVKSLKKPFFEDASYKLANEFFNKGLEELGLTRDTFPKITLCHNTEPNIHFKIAQAIQQQWRKVLGIETSLSNQEWKVYLDKLSKYDFEVARMGIYAPASPNYFLELFAYKQGSLSHTQWYSPEYERLYYKGISSTNLEERYKIFSQAEEILIDEMPIAPLFFYANSYLKRDTVKNVVVTSDGTFDLKWADIEN